MTEPQFTPPAQPLHPRPTTGMTPPNTHSGLAIASMVLGIVSIVSFMGFFLGIPAVILGVIALHKKSSEKTMAIVGIVTGAISTILSILVIALFIWAAYYAPGSADSTTDSPSSDWQTESEQSTPLPSNEI